MKNDFAFALAAIIMSCMVHSVWAGTVGSPNMVGFALAGVGETAAQEGTDYPDFVVKGEGKLTYLIFGGSYSSGNWTDWKLQTYYLKFGYSTEDLGLWLGFAVGGAGDVTGDTDNDVLIGDLCYLDICDPEDAKGKAWLVHDVVYTEARPTITLSAGAGAICDLTEISSSQAENWFGCSVGWAGNMNEVDEDEFIIGASLWDDTTNSNTDAGRAYIFLGDDNMPSTLSTASDGIALTGENEYNHFGCAVVGIDGFDSGTTDAVAVGASWYDKSSGAAIVRNNCGRVYIFQADVNLADTLAANADIIITGAGDDHFFGCSLASGDFISGSEGHDLAICAFFA